MSIHKCYLSEFQRAYLLDKIAEDIRALLRWDYLEGADADEITNSWKRDKYERLIAFSHQIREHSIKLDEIDDERYTG